MVWVFRTIYFIGIFIPVYHLFTRNSDKIKTVEQKKKKKTNLSSLDDKYEMLEALSEESSQTMSTLSDYMKRYRDGYFSYQRISNFLLSHGNPLNNSVGEYIFLKFFISFAVLVVFALGDSFIVGLVCTIPGFFLLDFLIYISDFSDNKEINLQLEAVADTLVIQITAGTYIDDALVEAFLMVTNKRLKKAFAQLTVEISYQQDIPTALTNFERKFTSVEAKSFVMTIRQSLVSGQVVDSLEDFSNNLKDANLVTLKEKNKQVESLGIYIQLAFFIGILFVLLISVFLSLATEASGLF